MGRLRRGRHGPGRHGTAKHEQEQAAEETLLEHGVAFLAVLALGTGSNVGRLGFASFFGGFLWTSRRIFEAGRCGPSLRMTQTARVRSGRFSGP